jgi:hypothetical protein
MCVCVCIFESKHKMVFSCFYTVLHISLECVGILIEILVFVIVFIESLTEIEQFKDRQWSGRLW